MTGGHYENTRRQFSSNEDFTKKISHSVFVTNFPDYVNSRDLWNKCSVYGTVIDVFIPNKKSKAGKRFAFVRFIKVFNLDRLVENLCTIWIGSYHLFANQVRYDRPQKPLNPNTNVPQKYGSKKDADQRNGSTGSHQKKGGVTSYVSVVNGVTPLVQPGNSLSSAPALVLDEECVVERDFSNCAMGRVKSFDSITKLQSLLVDEGFVNFVFFTYQNHFYYYYSPPILRRVGKVYMVRAKELFTWTPSFESIKEQDYSSEDESVQGSMEHSVHVDKEISADPFGLNDLLGLKKPVEENLEPSPSLLSAKVMNNSQVVHEDVSFNSVGGSGNNKGGSVLGVLDEMIRVGRAMGYSMEGCEKDIESIINSKGDEAVLR
ncbi:RNA-directed DNA polymerase, eukaryota [Tanacetum coccineum]